MCYEDIADGMLGNKLKLMNQDKRELLVVGSRYRPRPPLNHTQIGDDVISPWEHAKNLGVGFDQYFDFSEHVKMTCKIAFFRICGIAKVRRYLSHDTAKTIVPTYITSRLDSCNALYYGLPKYLIDRLQLAQNSAARLVTMSRRDDYITPILRRLRWLPVHHRGIFKILLLTYKALNGQTPSYVKDLVKYRNSGRVLRSSNKHLLNEPVAKLINLW